MFDLNGMRVVGRVVKDDGRKLFLEWPGCLAFRPEQQVSGTTAIKASIQPIMPQPRIYILRDAAIRGEFYLAEPWAKELYAEFRANCEKGLYGLNPFIEPVSRLVELPKDSVSPERDTGAVLEVATPATEPSDG